MKKIAIIGSGIAGLSAAYFLRDQHHLTLYEKNERLGGHSRTISAENTLVDTGFIVFNDRNYPNLMKLFKTLGLTIEKTEMSFALSVNGLEYSGSSINTIFAQRKNIFNLKMLRGLFDIYLFNNHAKDFVKKYSNITLGELLDKMKLKSWFCQNYLLPMGGAIWSCPTSTMLDFPAASFVHFFDNHGLLSINNRPQWYSLKDKSISYVRLLAQAIEKKNKIITNAKIQEVKRLANKVHIVRQNTPVEIFDEVIFACHPQEILTFSHDLSQEEHMALNKFSRQKNIAYTHSDISQMPNLKACWSSWNYLASKDSVSVTYWMNKLQNIKSPQIFVTLNPNTEIEAAKIYDVCEFYHPIFDNACTKAKEMIEHIQGKNKFWFCGAYLRDGFHEDGILSTIKLLEKMRCKVEDI